MFLIIGKYSGVRPSKSLTPLKFWRRGRDSITHFVGACSPHHLNRYAFHLMDPSRTGVLKSLSPSESIRKAHLGAFLIDLAVETVWCERVFIDFPVKQGKNREITEIWRRAAVCHAKTLWIPEG